MDTMEGQRGGAAQRNESREARGQRHRMAQRPESTGARDRPGQIHGVVGFTMLHEDGRRRLERTNCRVCLTLCKGDAHTPRRVYCVCVCVCDRGIMSLHVCLTTHTARGRWGRRAAFGRPQLWAPPGGDASRRARTKWAAEGFERCARGGLGNLMAKFAAVRANGVARHRRHDGAANRALGLTAQRSRTHPEKQHKSGGRVRIIETTMARSGPHHTCCASESGAAHPQLRCRRSCGQALRVRQRAAVQLADGYRSSRYRWDRCIVSGRKLRNGPNPHNERPSSPPMPSRSLLQQGGCGANTRSP